MSEIHVKSNESLESALRRFKRQTARDGILAEARKREHYEAERKAQEEGGSRPQAQVLMPMKPLCRTKGLFSDSENLVDASIFRGLTNISHVLPRICIR